MTNVHRLGHRAGLSRAGGMRKDRRNLLPELGLVLFDGHHIVAPRLDALLGYRALRQ